MSTRGAVLLLACWSFLLNVQAADWIRPVQNTNHPVWGIRGGLQFAIDPAGFRPRSPRGLIRLGYPVLPSGEYDLINFIAIEPVVNGKKGFSELEQSQIDQRQGKVFWAVAPGETPNEGAPHIGNLTQVEQGLEELRVPLRIEPFENGARVRLEIVQRSDAPDEVTLTVFAEPESAPMEFCILTATMGNMARTRLLWLKDEVINSLELYPDYKETGFARHSSYSHDRLFQTPKGDVLVAMTSDEGNPAEVFPFPNSPLWHYGGVPVTQFWKKKVGTFRDDLMAVVNARYTYWKSQRPIPGGIAYENFELRERFYDGQQFTFGITKRAPGELGFTATTKPKPR